MRIAVLIATAIALAGFAGATNEAHPDCEVGQEPKGEAGPVFVCEGEHWDGEDPTGASCSGSTVGANAEAACVSLNSGTEPAEPDTVGTNVHQQRASAQYAGDGAPSVYWYGGQYAVGQSSAYASADGRAAWWGRDGTSQIDNPTTGEPIFSPVIEELNARLPGGKTNEGGADGNLIAWVVGYQGSATPFPLAKVFTGEGDCTYAEYEGGDCPRDNTAVTVEFLP